MQETVDSLHLPKARMKTIRTAPTTMAFLLSSSFTLGGEGEGDVVVVPGFRLAGGEGDVVVMMGFRGAGDEGVTEGAVVVEETTTSGGGGGILGDNTGVGASVVVAVYIMLYRLINVMVVCYYDLPILRLIIGAEVDKSLRVCKSLVTLSKSLVTLSDISRPHSVGLVPPRAYSVFMSSLTRSSL